MQLKDTVDPAKQDGVAHRNPCECSNPVLEKIKEYDRDKDMPVPRLTPFLNTPTSPATIQFGTRLSLLGSRENIRLHPNNINGASGIEIPEEWMLPIKNTTTGERYNNGPLR